MKRKKLYEFWDENISPTESFGTKNPLTDYTIGIDTIDRMKSKMNSHRHDARPMTPSILLCLRIDNVRFWSSGIRSCYSQASLDIA